MKKRNFNSPLRALWIFLGLGIGYFLWLKLTGLAIPCLFRKITGWLCPGCGITTLLLSLAAFDFTGAYQANPFLFLTGPLILAELGYYFFLQLRRKKLPAWNNTLLIIYCCALCLFGVMRNIL